MLPLAELHHNYEQMKERMRKFFLVIWFFKVEVPNHHITIECRMDSLLHLFVLQAMNRILCWCGPGDRVIASFL